MQVFLLSKELSLSKRKRFGMETFPGGRKLESPESGLTVNIKVLLANGDKVALSSLSKGST